MENILLKNLKICVLVSNYATLKHSNGITNESPNLQAFLPSTFKPPWEWETRLIGKENVFQQILSIKKLEKFDVYFNLCDRTNHITGVEVIKALNFLNLPFTGSDEKFFSLRKQDMKTIALAQKILTPRYYFAFNETDIHLASKHLKKYPVIVKAFYGQENDKKLKCNDFDELFEHALTAIYKYGGALIEQFIEGREFSVMIIENPNKDKTLHTMKPIEVEYRTNDSSVQLSDKNNEYKEGKCVPSDNKELNEKLCEIARKAFVSMNGKSYGRADFRVNENNEIYFIELNFSPRIFMPNQPTRSDYILENDLTFKKERFIQVLIELAFKDHRKRQSPYYVAFREEVYGQRCLIANRDITKGKLKFLIEH
jgi:D-alanine-D-alanine ligase